ncbi:family 43 glycosylhydrolase [Dactylosporangium matsuzakiense]|uniref:family 43 glycosylhydrolase n=4 Tax=Dactylosporangium matsuzakiense TaxID=53360 RepID=UPI0021C270C6|nr:family 43 glycosylhydrolase [Dactylosporangium matsuzakiense]UWZ41414.1 family 43 glycosylhydrolase [Dactylosporangium matsuzakiense]
MLARSRRLTAALAASAAAGGFITWGVAGAGPASAAAGCRVDYKVTNQWQGGFGADVTVTNLGDAISGWALTWTYTAGQSVAQAWNAAVTQSGTTVTAKNVDYNANLATGGTANFGFNGAWNNSTNPVPAAFALNGVACTGAPATGSPAPSRSTGSSPSASASPSRSTGPSPSQSASYPPPPSSYPAPMPVAGDTGVHDPTIVKRPEGGYIIAYTGNNIALKTSTDRVTWRNAGAAFPSGASWTLPYTGNSPSLWAPDISYRNGRYVMYYAASTFGSNHSAIFLATSPTGAAGSWTNQGLVIESRTADNFNAIDPNLYVDDQGRWWLSFGSFWSGIKLVQLDPATGKRSDSTIRAIAGRNGGAIEAPFVSKHGAYYYQYVSFDLCCKGASSTYRVMVGRSTSPTGPFLDRSGKDMNSGGGTEILAGRGSIHGPGHEAVLADTDGDYLVYHYYADSGASYLGINHIGYDGGGWPYLY